MTLIARWGEQLDVRHITEAGDDKELSAEQVAGYIAKYATKATEALGVTLDHHISEGELEGLDVPMHVAELVRACFELAAGRPCRGCGCGSGRTCLASAATSRPRAAATRPPLALCDGPGSATPSVGVVAMRSH